MEAGSDPRGAKSAGEGGIWGGMLGMLREEGQLRGATFPFPVEGDDDGKRALKKCLLFAVQALKLHAHLPENSCTCIASLPGQGSFHAELRVPGKAIIWWKKARGTSQR